MPYGTKTVACRCCHRQFKVSEDRYLEVQNDADKVFLCSHCTSKVEEVENAVTTDQVLESTILSSRMFQQIGKHCEFAHTQMQGQSEAHANFTCSMVTRSMIKALCCWWVNIALTEQQANMFAEKDHEKIVDSVIDDVTGVLIKKIGSSLDHEAN